MEALDVFKLKATEIASLAPEEYNAFVDNFEASLVKVGTPVDCPLLHVRKPLAGVQVHGTQGTGAPPQSGSIHRHDIRRLCELCKERARRAQRV